MKGLTISDSTGNLLSFDLIDILSLLGEKAAASVWILSGVEAVGESAYQLQEISDTNSSVSGTLLLRLSSDVIQVIDGEFAGYCEGETAPWIIIRAIDSSAFEVETNDVDTINAIGRSFREIDEFRGL